MNFIELKKKLLSSPPVPTTRYEIHSYTLMAIVFISLFRLYSRKLFEKVDSYQPIKVFSCTFVSKQMYLALIGQTIPSAIGT